MVSATTALVTAPILGACRRIYQPLRRVSFAKNSGNNKLAVGADFGWMGGQPSARGTILFTFQIA